MIRSRVQIPPTDLPRLLTDVGVPDTLWNKVTTRLAAGDLTWRDSTDGLIVTVPPSSATTSRSSKAIRTYTVLSTSCTCRGFFARSGCYHLWLWAVIDAWLHPPVLTVTGAALLTLERAPLIAALNLVVQQAAGDIRLWFIPDQLAVEFQTRAGTTIETALTGHSDPADSGEAIACGSVAALRPLVAACPIASSVTLAVRAARMSWIEEITL